MSLSDDDISLQEPLIPFTWPQRDDPGWNLLDELGAASLEPQGDNGEPLINVHPSGGSSSAYIKPLSR